VDSHGDVYVAEVAQTFVVSRSNAREDCHTFQEFQLTR
jgi:hypothetical protein